MNTGRDHEADKSVAKNSGIDEDKEVELVS